MLAHVFIIRRRRVKKYMFCKDDTNAVMLMLLGI
jgi:hypothetical protein